MRILALDLGTCTGWAINDDGVIRSGMEDFTPKKGDHIGQRYLDFHSWIDEMLDSYELDYVYYEMPHMRGRRATEVLHGFLAHLQHMCAWFSMDSVGVHSGTIKKFATGNGRASKEDMIVKANCFLHDYNKSPLENINTMITNRVITDDNEADAICLLKYAESQFKEE